MTKRFIQRIEWELTRRCNLNCRHCDNRPGRPRRSELNTHEALNLARTLARHGCSAVTLSGGEPLLRADWPQIAASLSRAGVVVQMISNGLRLGRTEARLARAAGVGAVLLSVDGIGATHNKIRRHAGAFRAVQRAADRLREVDVPVGFITTLVRSNVDQLEGLATWVSGWDPVVWQVWLGRPAHREPIWLTPTELSRAVDRLVALAPQCAALSLGDNIGYQVPAERLRRVDDLATPSPEPCGWRCEAGRSLLGLRSDGTVTGCLALPPTAAVGNLRATPISELWRLADEAHTRRVQQLTGGCRDCPQATLCQGGCHAMALNNRGELDNSYCLAPWRSGCRQSRRSLAGVAAYLTVAGFLGVACGPQAEPHTPSAPPPPADAAVIESHDGAPAPSKQPPPEKARSQSRTQQNRTQQNRAQQNRTIPKCMTSHVGCYHLRRFHRAPKKP